MTSRERAACLSPAVRESTKHHGQLNIIEFARAVAFQKSEKCCLFDTHGQQDALRMHRMLRFENNITCYIGISAVK